MWPQFLAVEDGVGGFRVGAVVAEVVPALRAQHHPAGGALLLSASAMAVPLEWAMRSYMAREVSPVSVWAIWVAEGDALDFELGELKPDRGRWFPSAGALALQGGGSVVDGGVGEDQLGRRALRRVPCFRVPGLRGG